MARLLLGCGFTVALVVGLFVLVSPREAASHNLQEPACRMDGLAGNNPKSVKAGEFQVTGTYIPPAGATNIRVVVMILDSYGRNGGTGWATHAATVDEAKKTWSVTVANQKPDTEIWVGARIEFTLEGMQMEQPPPELRNVRIKN